MEKMEANIIIANGCKLSIPKSWAASMRITPEDKNVDLYFDGEKILIEKASFRPCEKKRGLQVSGRYTVLP